MEKSKAVANFFIEMAKAGDREPMTQLRLHKLLYYAQAWSLVRNKRLLFSDEIEAWDLGPVVSSLYGEYKQYGNQPISFVDKEYSPSIFDQEELALLIDVLREYDQYTTSTLVNRTHRACEPWDQAYKGGSRVITPTAMIDCFSSMKPLRTFEDALKEVPEIGYRDEDDYLVLPAELNHGGDADAL